MTQLEHGAPAPSRVEGLALRILLSLCVALMLMIFPVNSIWNAIEALTALGEPEAVWLGLKVATALIWGALVVHFIVLSKNRARDSVLPANLRLALFVLVVVVFFLVAAEAAAPAEYQHWFDLVGPTLGMAVLALTIRAFPARLALAIGVFAIAMRINVGGSFPMLHIPNSAEPLISMVAASAITAWIVSALPGASERLRQPWIALFAACGGVVLANDAGAMSLPTHFPLALRLALPILLLLSLFNFVQPGSAQSAARAHIGRWVALGLGLFAMLMVLYDAAALRWAFDIPHPQTQLMLIVNNRVEMEIMAALAAAAAIALFIFRVPERMNQSAGMAVLIAGLVLCLAALVGSGAIAYAVAPRRGDSDVVFGVFGTMAVFMWSWPFTALGEAVAFGGLLRLLLTPMPPNAEHAVRA